MKTNQILCIALLIFSCSDDDAPIPNIVEAACLTNTLGNSIIAFYPFNSGALTDESGDNHNLLNTTNATSTLDRNGNANCAFLFDNRTSQSEYLSINDASFLDGLNEFSVSLWYQITNDDVESFSTLQGLVERGMERHCGDKNGEWSLGLSDCSKAVFGHSNSVWANPMIDGCQEQLDAQLDIWRHVVAVYNGNNSKIYIDGVLNGEANGNPNCNGNDIESKDLFIGFNFTGAIDDIIIYDRELSPSEVSDLFQADTCCE